MSKVWIDKETGTYGSVTRKRFYYFPSSVMEAWDEGRVTDNDLQEYAELNFLTTHRKTQETCFAFIPATM